MTSKKTEIAMNGYIIKDIEHKKILSMILKNMPNISCWSYHSLKILYIELHNLIVEYCEIQRELLKGSEKAKLTRYIKKILNGLKYIPENQQKMLEKLFEIMLCDDGLSTLKGFGIGSGLSNAETKRLTIDHNIKIIY